MLTFRQSAKSVTEVMTLSEDAIWYSPMPDARAVELDESKSARATGKVTYLQFVGSRAFTLTAHCALLCALYRSML